ncbi:hypothetical protein F4814DRAFT_175041 [Daldinia grandis]|nr:hypothetical protein F4814DRAFT_175041 [Daldinia grandis]
MAPNLNAIKDISARISCFGRNHKDQGSIDNDKPSQIPNSTMAKTPSNPFQPKSHGQRNTQHAMFPKKENIPTSSIKPSAQLVNPYLVAQPPATGISYQAMSPGYPLAGKKSTNNQNLGSSFTPTNSSSSVHPHKGYSSMASHDPSGSSQVPGTSAKNHPGSISWFPPYPEGLPHIHTQPAPPLASHDAIDPLWGQPLPFAEHSFIHPLYPMHALSPEDDDSEEPSPGHLHPPHLGAWPEQTPGLNGQPGLTYEQQLWNSYISKHANTPGSLPVNGFEMFSPFLQPGQGPQDDKMDIDGLSLEDNAEGSTEPTSIEQPPEIVAVIEAGLADLKPLVSFVQGLLDYACAGCRKKKAMGPEDIINMTATWISDKGKVGLGLKCQDKRCQVVTCLGCGKAIHFTMLSRSTVILKAAGVNTTMQWCCNDGRLAAIWALACGWKVPSSKSRAGSMITKVRGKVKIKRAMMFDELRGYHPPAIRKGIGYGDENMSHAYYFGQYTHHPKRAAPKPSIDTKDDLAHEIYFRLLALLLPSPKRASPFDVSPPSLLSHILPRSPLLEDSAMMLTNGSIDEISSRSQLYDSALDFFEALGNHPATSSLIYANRDIYYENGGHLLEASLSPEKSKDRIVPRDTGKPLVELLGGLAAQSETLLRYSQSNPIEFQTFEGQMLLKLGRRLSEVSTRHTASMQQLQTAMDVTKDKSDIDFSEWHRENCVRDVPDEAVLRNFAYAREASREASPWPVVGRGRMKRLITEISTLQSSLPEGIFICHGSSRLDIMKVLIIGPRDTPYEHGLFEFDLYCPLDYPRSPPKILFKTPNSSRSRFNPNLYHDGKVCLSLLGTWPGEPWRVDQSTLLQVLVSIQAMIFCEEPWYNEPGRESYKEKGESDNYNNQVRGMTIQHAQLPWIKAVGAKDATQDVASGPSMVSLWQETARLYLRANTKEILDLAKKVSKANVFNLENTARTLKVALKASGYID